MADFAQETQGIPLDKQNELRSKLMLYTSL